MTREEFFDLAERVHAYARRHPRRYRWKVALLAAFGYATLFGMMAVCAGLLIFGTFSFTQPWFWETVGRNVRLIIIWVGMLISLAAVLFSMVRSLFVAIPAPSGLRVQRADAPELFATIDRVVAASNAPQPHTVLLSWDFNASVCQRPRLGWLGWTRDYLVIGVPLMAALTTAQFTAVLAHEFGHLRGGHGRFGNWVYRLRAIWDQILARLVRRRQKIVLLIARFLRWYTPRFSAYTYALARTQEFEADRWAAQVAGLPAAGEALINIWTRSVQLQEQFWQPLNARACYEAEVPQGVFAPMLTLLRRPVVRADQRRWLRTTLGRITDGTDTHPAPAERLSSLGLPATLDELDADEMWPDETGPETTLASGEAEGEPTAARTLLGARLDEYLAELETSWRVVTRPAWQKRFERAKEIRARLEVLVREETTAPGGELPQAAAWERARLEADVAQTPAEARAAMEHFVSRWPAHAAGRFVLGQMLLGDEDEAGIAHLEEAKRLDGRLTADSEAAVAAYLRRAGQTEAAEERRRNSVRHADVLDAARTERQRVTARDRFLPHGLGGDEIAALRAHMAKHPRVSKVWLARKEVVHHPEQPWHVLVCMFAWRWNEAASRKRVDTIFGEIRQGLTVAGGGDFYFLLVDTRHRNNPLARKVRKTVGAEVYPPPVPKGRRKWWGGRHAVTADLDPAAPAGMPEASLPALRVAPPPPVIPPLLPRLPSAPPRPVGDLPRKVAVIALCVSLLVVFLPLAFIVPAALRPGGAWEQMRTALLRGVRSRHGNGMMAEASQPIPRDPQASTEEEDRRMELAWAQRTMLGGYDHAGRRNPRWNTAAHAFIERALPWWAGLHDSTVTANELLPQARNVLRTGCDDPLVLYLAGLLEERTDRQSPAAAPLFSRAVTGFQNTPYARAVAMSAAAEMVADCNRRRDGTGQSGAVKQWWLLWFQQSLSDGSYQSDEQTVLANRLSQGEGALLFEECRAACCEAVEKAGDAAVAPWLRLYLSGNRHMRDAWAARGNDYASKVTPEGWRGFRAGLALARRDLVASWRSNPSRPEAASWMISVALGQNVRGLEGPRTWFDRAVRAQVDYDPAYNRFYNTLLPQWGGSEDAVLTFGLRCAATTDYNTSVPMQLNEAANRMDPGRGYGNSRVYAALEQVYAGYEAAPSQAGRRVYYHNWHARAAALTGRYPEAYQLLKEVDFAVSPDMAAELADSQENGVYLERIAAYGGPGGADAQAGDRLVERGRQALALERFRAALAAGKTEPHAAAYLQSRIGMLEAEQQLAAGSWVSFQPTAGTGGAPVGWTSKLGSWRVAGDGALIGQAGASGLMLVSNAKVGADFEIRGELDFLPGAASEEQSGVVFGHPDMESDDWQSFRLKRNGPDGAIATISCHWHDGPKRPVTVPNHNTFLLHSQHGQITLTINGEVMFRDQRLDGGQVNDGSVLVGLGGYAHQGNSFTVAYRKLQLRRLTGEPLALNGGTR